MRNAFAEEITALAREDDRVVLLSGDIGNRLFDSFKEHAPKRFFNCGIAEQNMIGIAAGLGLSGHRPVAYTITPFITTRCYEQIRVDLCYHKVPAVIVGVGSGFSYASLGATHHSCEDIAIMRALPHMTVLCPADSSELREALRAAFECDGPVYLRIGKKGEPRVHEGSPQFQIGKGIVLQEGTEIALIATGTIAPVAIEAASFLSRQGISVKVVSMPSIKPLDIKLLTSIFSQVSVVATIEEHSIIGGLGGAVAEFRSDLSASRGRPDCSLHLRFGSGDDFMREGGETEHARMLFGLTGKNIALKVVETFRLRVSNANRN